jgi:TM2 domain-containing membrane protein YozV
MDNPDNGTLGDQQPPVPIPPPVTAAPLPAADVKNSALALILRFLMPGLGQIYNNQVGKGVALIVGYLVSMLLAIVLIGFVFMFAIWIYAMVDAYQTAEQLNGRR